MSAVRLAVGELRRITAGRLPKFAALALAVIPLLYGGLYLYANHDPYANLSHVPAAVVVEDTGATTAQGQPLHAGQQVADDLVSSGSFEWHRTTAAEAEDGVRTGRYDFAVTMPADFSSALASSGRFAPRQGALILTTNDANNYIARTIADRVTDQVRDSLARQVGERAATDFLAGFARIHDQLSKAVAGAGQLVSGAQQAKSGADKLPPVPTSSPPASDACSTGRRSWSPGRPRRRPALAAGRRGAPPVQRSGPAAPGHRQLPAQTAALSSGARQVAAGNARIARVGNRVATASGRLVGSLGSYRAQLDAELRAQGVPAAERAGSWP